MNLFDVEMVEYLLLRYEFRHLYSFDHNHKSNPIQLIIQLNNHKQFDSIYVMNFNQINSIHSTTSFSFTFFESFLFLIIWV